MSNSESAAPKLTQVPCPNCGGIGITVVSHEMAVDAGDGSMEGTEWICSHCNGDGWILVAEEEADDAE